MYISFHVVNPNSLPPRDGTLRFGQQSCVEGQQILSCKLNKLANFIECSMVKFRGTNHPHFISNNGSVSKIKIKRFGRQCNLDDICDPYDSKNKSQQAVWLKIEFVLLIITVKR